MTILMGIKHSGKSSLGKLAAKTLDIPFFDLDILLEEQYSKDRKLNYRELYVKLGESGFRDLETRAVQSIDMSSLGILSLGGGTIDNSAAMMDIEKAYPLVFLDTGKSVLFERIKKNGFPSFLEKSPIKLFDELFLRRRTLYSKAADITLKITDESPEELLQILLKKIGDKK